MCVGAKESDKTISREIEKNKNRREIKSMERRTLLMIQFVLHEITSSLRLHFNSQSAACCERTKVQILLSGDGKPCNISAGSFREGKLFSVHPLPRHLDDLEIDDVNSNELKDK